MGQRIGINLNATERPAIPRDLKRCTISSLKSYHVVLRHSDEGYSVSCPGLPGCFSQGATEEEALKNIQDAIRGYLEVAEELARENGGKVVEIAVA